MPKISQLSGVTSAFRDDKYPIVRNGVTLWSSTKTTPTVLNRPIRIATFGDSTAYVGDDILCDMDGVDFPIQAAANTTVVFGGCAGPWYTVPNVQIIGNGGIGGNTTTQMLSRSGAVYSTTRKAFQDVINTRPDIVLYRGGSINDVVTYDENTPMATVDAQLARHFAGVRRFTSAGIPVIDSGIYGYSKTDASPETIAARKAIVVYINNAVKAFALTEPLVHYWDVEGVLSVAGSYLPNVSSDGVHLAPLGYGLAAKKDGEIINGLFQSSGGINSLYDFQYDFAAGIPSTPANCVSSVVGTGTKINGNINNCWLVRMTGATGSPKVSMAFNALKTSLASLVTGDKFQFTTRVDITGPGYARASSDLLLYDAANTFRTNYSQDLVDIIDGVAYISSPVVKLDRDGTALGTSSNMKLSMTLVTAGDYDLLIYPPKVIKVP